MVDAGIRSHRADTLGGLGELSSVQLEKMYPFMSETTEKTVLTATTTKIRGGRHWVPCQGNDLGNNLERFCPRP